MWSSASTWLVRDNTVRIHHVWDCLEGWVHWGCAAAGSDGQCSICSGLNCSTLAVLVAKLRLKGRKLPSSSFPQFLESSEAKWGEDLNYWIRWFPTFYEPDCFVVQGEEKTSQIQIILLRIELLIGTKPIF